MSYDIQSDLNELEVKKEQVEQEEENYLWIRDGQSLTFPSSKNANSSV